MPRFLFALLALVLALPAQAQVPNGTVVDGIAAVVGDEIVLTSEVNSLAQQAAQGQPITNELWSRALDDLVRQRVLVIHAQRDTTIIIGDDMVEEQLDNQVAQLAAQLGSVEALETYYRKTLDEIKATFRSDVRKQLLAERLRVMRMRDVTVTPGEVREWYDTVPLAQRPTVGETVRVAHIVKIPAPTEAADQAARTFLGALRDSIAAGDATIEELARRHSDDGGSGARGGLIENIELRLLVPEFAAVAGSIEPGELSQAFKSPFGYHILRVNQREGQRVSFNHILISVEMDESATEMARQELLALRDSIQTHGVPFEKLAREFSEDEYSAARGGFVSDPASGARDLQTQALGPQWQATLSGMEVGDISEPAEVRLLDAERTAALHIVLLQKRTPPHSLSVDTDYALLSNYALGEKRREVFDQWVRRLQRDVFVEVRSDRYEPEA